MDKIFKIGPLVLGAVLVAIYWFDARPILHNTANGQYQQLPGGGGILDTRQGTLYFIRAVQGDPVFGATAVNPRLGAVIRYTMSSPKEGDDLKSYNEMIKGQ
jgi:hypothetical protein